MASVEEGGAGVEWQRAGVGKEKTQEVLELGNDLNGGCLVSFHM